jgi:hypothetical protein
MPIPEDTARHRVSEKDCLRIEAWARRSNHHAILTLIETFPRLMEFTRPVLLGTSRGQDVFIEGLPSRSVIGSIMRTLDESFDPATPRTFTHTLKKQTQDLGAEIYGTMAQTLSAGFERLCFLESTGQCQRGVIRAHAIQEALIRQLAINGHVLEFNLFHKLPRNEFRNWPQSVGVDCVSTFTGFCGHHDHEVFRPIENGLFNPTSEALFLYGYRALCSTLYSAKYRFEIVKAMAARVQASGVDPASRQDQDIRANELNTRELEEIKATWDRDLMARAFDRYDHLALACPKTPDLIGTLFLSPPKNFRHEFAQFSRYLKKLEWLAFSVVPRSGGGGLVLISAEKGSAVWPGFTQSLLHYPPDKRTMVIVNYLICCFGENLILAPFWWDRLPLASRHALVNAHTAGYYPRHLKGLCDWGPLVPLIR